MGPISSGLALGMLRNYIEEYIVYELIVHDDAADDLEGILQQDVDAGTSIAALLEQLMSDQDLLDRLTQDGFGGSLAHPVPRGAKFNIKKWGAAQQRGLNLWRMRAFDSVCDQYRIVYAFNPETTCYCVLGIGKKAIKANDISEFDYELDAKLSTRIRATYQRILDA